MSVPQCPSCAAVDAASVPVLHEANKHKPPAPAITALRPPSKRSPIPVILAGLIVAGIFLAFKVWLVAAMAVAGSGYYVWQALQFNREVLPGRREDWKRSYVCRKCRTTFVWRETDEGESA